MDGEEPGRPTPDKSQVFESPFLSIPAEQWIAGNRSGFAIWDRYPVSPGHVLIVSHRPIPTWWEATPEERVDLLALVDEAKRLLDDEHGPDGYNVGFNAGLAAGQTVAHLHIHVIPRYSGDVPDPRGGIRHVIPGRGTYFAPAEQAVGIAGTGSLHLFDGLDGSFKLELLRSLWNERFDRADLVVSFIMRSGLDLIGRHLEDALDRGTRVRILTTDYLHITDADALTRLLDLADGADGRLEARVFHDDTTSFHPKAYLFWSSDGHAASAFVGSSNLSRGGIAEGVEWNLGVDRVAPMRASFERIWSDPRSRPLSSEWLRTYRQQASPSDIVAVDVEIDEPLQAPEARPVQRDALDALEQTRLAGFTAGLVVMATGLGKTWLAAFDTARPQFRRVLFVAHRDEILRQSRDVFRRVQPDGDFGLYLGGERRREARVVFAGVQTLARHLDEFPPDAFDYVVVDEFHHAAAASYRRVLGHFAPRFLLGLTATPERIDGADLLALCGDNLVYDCDLVQGIRQGELVPFAYWGIRDALDFRPIPWRNGRFDAVALTEAVETRERARQAFDEWSARRGDRTLAFCVSKTHADFMAEFFAAEGIACASVHTGPTSAPRQKALDDLRSGALEVLFCVDLFNEGLDVPLIDTVLMLRPTESPVIFLQQLGRGLRRAGGKEKLTVIDFIGNHRSFLLKPRTLLGLGTSQAPSTAAVIKAMSTGEFALPSGCSVSFDLTLIEMFRQLVGVSMGSRLEDYCRSYFEEEGIRPSAIQALRAAYNPASARAKHGSWFGLLADLDLLGSDEANVARAAGEVLAGLESERVTKSYKLVTLRALLHDDSLRSGADVSSIAATARLLVLADPRLLRDATNKDFPDLAAASTDRWDDYWRRWPIAAWIGELRSDPGRWFRLDGNRLVPTFRVDAKIGPTFDAMVGEIVDYRLAQYLGRMESAASGAWRCKVDHAGGRPIVRLDRGRYPGLPEGSAPFVADGREYIGQFVNVALNTAALPDQPGNALHDLLRGWFGPSAGQPGTHHYVLFELVEGRLLLRREDPPVTGRGEALG